MTELVLVRTLAQEEKKIHPKFCLIFSNPMERLLMMAHSRRLTGKDQVSCLLRMRKDLNTADFGAGLLF